MRACVYMCVIFFVLCVCAHACARMRACERARYMGPLVRAPVRACVCVRVRVCACARVCPRRSRRPSQTTSATASAAGRGPATTTSSPAAAAASPSPAASKHARPPARPPAVPAPAVPAPAESVRRGREDGFAGSGRLCDVRAWYGPYGRMGGDGQLSRLRCSCDLSLEMKRNVAETERDTRMPHNLAPRKMRRNVLRSKRSSTSDGNACRSQAPSCLLSFARVKFSLTSITYMDELCIARYSDRGAIEA
jgi:hypothetical protein